MNTTESVKKAERDLNDARAEFDRARKAADAHPSEKTLMAEAVAERIQRNAEIALRTATEEAKTQRQAELVAKYEELCRQASRAALKAACAPYVAELVALEDQVRAVVMRLTERHTQQEAAAILASDFARGHGLQTPSSDARAGDVATSKLDVMAALNVKHGLPANNAGRAGDHFPDVSTWIQW